MNRKDFLKNSILASTGALMTGSVNGKKQPNEVTSEQVGFNHLPIKEQRTMNSVLHKSETRGHANHGWLDSHHTFSFASYYDPSRMSFGVLRVLNDDVVAPGMGFGKHPHDNMEIISIPLSGDLEHQDSIGNKAIIKEGDVQVMSAGTGIFHSEYNANKDKEVRFLQIWVIPSKQNVTPRYDQVAIADLQQPNKFSQILSPNPDDEGVWVYQNSWFNMGSFEEGKSEIYKLNSTGNGVYAFVLEGKVSINGQELSKRDGYGVWDIDQINLTSKTDSKVLLMEVPMS